MTELAVEVQAYAKEKSKKYYDQKTQKREFAVGDKVLVLLPEDSTGMEAQWHGPYEVIEKPSPVSYKLHFPDRTRQFHLNALKQWNEPRNIMTVLKTNIQWMIYRYTLWRLGLSLSLL